jgi:putative ABC transport system permease protein
MRNLLAMFSIVVKRLRHSLGLTLSAWVGILCVLTIAISIPVFTYAVSGELLRQQLAEQYSVSGHPLFSIRMYYQYTSRAPIDMQKALELSQSLPKLTRDLVGIRPKQTVVEMNTGLVNLKMLPGPEAPDWSQADQVNMKLKFATMNQLPEHAELREGSWPETGKDDSGPIQVAIYEDLADLLFINVGQQYQLSNGIIVEVSGLWKEINRQDEYWYNRPENHFQSLMWVPEETFRDRIAPILQKPVQYVSWYIVMDENAVSFQRAGQYTEGMLRLNNELNNMTLPMKMDYSPLEGLIAFQTRVKSLTSLLYAVGAPLVVLALLFIGLTSVIVVQEYEQEISMLRSRGASQAEVILMNVVESLILILTAFPVALFLGWFGANLMGQTESFLKFTQRAVLPFSYNGLNLASLLLAVLLIILSRISPAWRISKRTIVRLKQEQSRSETRPAWQRFYLDVILLGVSAYTYFSLRGWASVGRIMSAASFLNQRGLEIPAEAIQRLQPESQSYRDPLLFIAPAIFAIACSMLLMRFVPLIARLFSAVFGRLPGIWHYLSLQQISRRPQDYSSALLLIMISLSLAIFSATAAKTLDAWLYDSVSFESGSDLVIWEVPPEAFTSAPGMPGQAAAPVVHSRDRVVGSGLTLADLGVESEWSKTLERYRNLEGIQDATRVGRYTASVSSGSGDMPAEVIGVDRQEFPQVAFWREDFADASLGTLMNALGSDPRALLIPRGLAESKNLQTGDEVTMTVSVFDQAYVREFKIAGVYDYFPTVYPQPQPVVIANLEYIFGSPDSIVDTDTWLTLDPGAEPAEVLEKIFKQLYIIPAVRADATSKIREEQATIERVGVFGVLNVGFLTAGLMPAIGFILYSYASLRRRFIQLGILQAIGLSVRQLIGYLASEQLLLMSFAILGGAAVGLGASHIFVPFLQSEVQPIPPFQIFSGLSEAAWLSLIFAGVLLLTMVGTIAYLSRLKVFQAIKLGETV